MMTARVDIQRLRPGYSLGSRGDNEDADAAYATLQFPLNLLAPFDDDARLTRGYYTRPSFRL